MRRSANYFKLFSRYLKKSKFVIAMLVLFSLVLASMQLIFPMLWGNILNNFVNITSIDYNLFIKYLLIYIILEFIEGTLTIIKNLLYSSMEEKITLFLKEDLCTKILALEMKAFDKNRVSSFTQKITEDTHILIASFMKIIYMTINILKLIALIVITFVMYMEMGVIFLVSSIIIYFAIYLLKPFEIKSERVLQSQLKNYSSSLYNDIRNIREIKTLGIKKYTKNKLRDRNNEINKNIVTIKGTNNLLELLNFTLRFSIHSIVLVASSYFFYTVKIEFMYIIVFELYASILFNTIKQLTFSKEAIMTYKTSLKSIFDILSNKSFENEKFGTRDELDTNETLIIKNLSFAYGNNKMLLDDICFEIEFGKKVAIVDLGENTKHIFANLLMRLYEPTEGRIMIGNVNIKELSEKALRRVISYVSSNPYIIDDTIENNLRLVKPNASLDEIEDACIDANIFKWFKKYDNEDILKLRLGKNGYVPNEVQRQQLAIARAMLLKSSIVIIDEIESNLDVEEMYNLSSAIDNISDATVIMLSENMAELTTCDEIITLKDSIIANIKGHNDIVKSKNIYSKMAELERQRREEINLYKEKNKNNDKKVAVRKRQENFNRVNVNKGESDEEHRIFSQIW